jgi:hypothetical protein
MEGSGSYNRHARIAAGGAALAVPLLEQTAREVELGGGDSPVLIANYGSSQGKNSLSPMQAVIRTLRGRVGSDRPIFVFHIDQPTNDFNTLFEVLDKHPDRYALGEPNVWTHSWKDWCPSTPCRATVSISRERSEDNR